MIVLATVEEAPAHIETERDTYSYIKLTLDNGVDITLRAPAWNWERVPNMRHLLLEAVGLINKGLEVS